MKRKFLAVLLAVLCVGGTACGMSGKNESDADSTASQTEEVKGMKGTRLTAENAKLIGRTYLAESGTLWCGLSGSGAEFEFTGKNLDIMVEGDKVSWSGQKDNYTRIAIYVDGERVVDDMLNEGLKKYTPISGDTEVTKTVRIV